MLSLNSTAMLVRGAMRYIDDDDLTLTPKLIDATTYVTVDAAEMLFNAYADSDEENGALDFRFDFRSDTSRLLLNKKSGSFDGEPLLKNEYLIYINGVSYMPLRKTAYLAQEAVKYIDGGYILIGKGENVEEIAANSLCLSYGKEKLDKFIPSETAVGKGIFVSPTGGDFTGDGSIDKPYRTIAKASAKAQSGDTIYIREGVYREAIKPVNNGSYTRPITYKAYNNEKVVITAADTVTGFISADGIIAEAACSIDLGRGRNQIYYKGKAFAEARFPNFNPEDYTASDVSPLFPSKGNLKLDYTDENYYVTNSSGVKTSYKVTSPLLDGDEDGKWVGATFMSHHGGAWNIGSAIVDSSMDGSFTVDRASVTKQWWFNGNNTHSPQEFGYLTGHKNAIDIPGEWVIADGKLTIYLPDGETADTLSVDVKSRQLCADLSHKAYIHLDGLEMIGGSITMDDSTMCVVKNCDMKYTSQFDYSMDQREGYIEDCNNFNTDGAPQSGEVGVYISGSNNVFRDCSINETAGAALYLTGLYTLVENNEFLNCGYAGSTVGGIYIGTVAWGNYNDQRGGYVIRYNTVRNAARAALTLQTTENKWNIGVNPAVYIPCEISYNQFSNGGIATSDSGVVYFWGATMGTAENPTQLHHNVVYMDCNTPCKLIGFIYHDNWTNTMETRQNLIFYSEENLVYGAYDGDDDDSILVQSEYYFPTSYAVVNVHDNVNMGYVADGLSAISGESYPGGLYFNSGVQKK